MAKKSKKAIVLNGKKFVIVNDGIPKGTKSSRGNNSMLETYLLMNLLTNILK